MDAMRLLAVEAVEVEGALAFVGRVHRGGEFGMVPGGRLAVQSTAAPVIARS